MWSRWATPQQIISNALFDQGYKRWQVTVHADEVYRATFWARRAEDIEDYYIGQGAEMVEIMELPLARFNAQVTGSKSVMTKTGWQTVPTYCGDVILSDEFLAGYVQAKEEQRARAARSDGSEAAPRDGDTDQDVA